MFFKSYGYVAGNTYINSVFRGTEYKIEISHNYNKKNPLERAGFQL